MNTPSQSSQVLGLLFLSCAQACMNLNFYLDDEN